MELRITGKHDSLAGGAWYVGRVGSYHFEALVFAEPSQYGIEGGHVSKLYLWAAGPRGKRRESLVVYERAWEQEPAEEMRPVVEFVVQELSRREREQRTGEE
jgi:hypothetical protein